MTSGYSMCWFPYFALCCGRSVTNMNASRIFIEKIKIISIILPKVHPFHEWLLARVRFSYLLFSPSVVGQPVWKRNGALVCVYDRVTCACNFFFCRLPCWTLFPHHHHHFVVISRPGHVDENGLRLFHTVTQYKYLYSTEPQIHVCSPLYDQQLQ
jgi:hypothetical protein